MQCIDTTFAGVDPSVLDGGLDPFGQSYDADVMRRMGTVLDECFQRSTRVASMAARLSAAGVGTEEQVHCAAVGFEAIVAQHGGYLALMQTESDLVDETEAAFHECGIEGSAVRGNDGSSCEVMVVVLETAIEAYYADNGVDADSWDDVVPFYLKEDPSNQFEFVPAAESDSGTPAVHGIGKCEGYGD